MFGGKLHTARFPIDFYDTVFEPEQDLKIEALLDKKKRFSPSRLNFPKAFDPMLMPCSHFSIIEKVND